MNRFVTKALPIDRDYAAPDGSDVRVLLGLECGGCPSSYNLEQTAA